MKNTPEEHKYSQGEIVQGTILKSFNMNMLSAQIQMKAIHYERKARDNGRKKGRMKPD